MPTTKHSHRPNYGKKVAGCPRCTELAAGAEPVTWAPSRKKQDAQQAADLKAHFASAKHRSGGCGLVCTFGDW